MARRAKAPVSLASISGMPEVVRRLVCELGKIPGVGERTATRYALFLATADLGASGPLAGIEQAAGLVRERVRRCPTCRALRDVTDGERCGLCADGKREAGLVCVVASEADMLAMERSGAYRGRYFVLGALVDPLEGVGSDELPIGDLVATMSPVVEVILALPDTVEGNATALTVAKAIEGTGVMVSALARGIAHGASLEHADEKTVAKAIEGRTVM